MAFKFLLFIYRKPGITREEFKKYYDEYVELVQSLVHTHSPVSHKRYYIYRGTAEGSSGPLPPGVSEQPSDSDFDSVTEITFPSVEAFQASQRKLKSRDIIPRIREAQAKFLDLSRLRMMVVEEVCEGWTNEDSSGRTLGGDPRD